MNRLALVLMMPNGISSSSPVDGMSCHTRSMTNSTPTILIWVNQYLKYQQYIEQGLSDEASCLKKEIDEALPLIDLTWKDLEQAAFEMSNS